MGIWLDAQIAFRNKAPHILAINCSIEFVIVASLLVFSYITNCDPATITEVYRWVAITIAFLAQIYFAYKAIRKSNMVQLKAFLLLSLITTVCIYIKFSMIPSQCSDSSHQYITWIVIGLTVIIAINQLFFVLSYKIAKDRFVERMMREIRAIDKEIESYELWNGLKAMISINFLVQTLILLGYITFYDYEKDQEKGQFYWFIVDGVTYFLFIIFSRIGYVAVMSKNKVGLVNTYLLFLSVLQAYELFRLVLMIMFAMSDNMLKGYMYSVIISQIVITLIGIIIQAVTFHLAFKFKDIGPDLMQALLDNQKSDDDNDSEVN